MCRLVTYVFLSVMAAGSVIGGEFDTTDVAVTDSFKVIPDSAIADSVPPVEAASIVDSILLLYPTIDLDTLTEAQRLLVEFETRYLLRQQQQRQVETKAEFSYYDSLVSYFVTPRWDLRGDIDRSFYHDAGDYFRFDPGFFVLEHQVTPMRKTVQPYGLSGNRLAVIVGRRHLAPFEHNIEPDGLIDLNDIPTALDHHVAILPGPVGLLFGGQHAAATLMTRPRRPDSTAPESCFLVDKGSYAYSYARGRFSKRFAGGRNIDMSIGYRNADGPFYGRGDDAYHQRGDFYFPLGLNLGFHAGGWLYDRRGEMLVRPDVGGRSVRRDRMDRFGRLSFVAHDESHTEKYELAYTHIRQASNLDDGYVGRFNHTGHALSFSREWSLGRAIARSGIDGDYLEYDDWYQSHSRLTGGASLSLAWLTRPYRLAVDLRQRYVEDYRFLPAASAMLSRDTDRSFLMLALGYSERAPSLHELHLRRQTVSVYGVSLDDYTDQGNPSLGTEQQLIGSAEIELGSLGNNVGLSVTGGKIIDGIDWQNVQEGDNTLFMPANGDISFVTATADARITLADFLRFKGGGSYHYLDYAGFPDRAYAPEYQAFSGMELHLFWSQKLIDLYAYGEFLYTGPYHGYVQQNLGDQALFNTKLSFRMGSFRFHWVIQNVLLTTYSPREYFHFAGRYNYYGFTWEFLN